MKVCQLSHVEQTYNFLAPLTGALITRGATVVAACNLEDEGREARRYLGDDVELHQVPAARRLSARALSIDVLEMARYLRRERFDVLHVHGPLVSMQARLAARLAGVPVVIYQAHGFYFHDGTRPLARSPLLLLEKAFCRYLTDFLVTVNEEDALLARLHRFRPSADQIVNVPGVGIDVARFHPAGNHQDEEARAKLRAELGASDESTVVLFVGRLVAEKGVNELAQAFACLARTDATLHLWLAGDVLGGERDRTTAATVGERLAHGPAGDRVRLLGRRNDIPELLRAADVFVLPSYREGMPVSLLEAMASGLAVVASDVRGCREAVRDGVTGVLVPPRDSGALSLGIQRLVRSPGLRARLGDAGRGRVEEVYSVERSLAPLLELYDALPGWC